MLREPLLSSGLVFLTVVSFLQAGCVSGGGGQGGGERVELVSAIPVALAGFDGPSTGQGGPGSAFNGVVLDGGFAGREWWSPEGDRFVLAAILDFGTEAEAGRRFQEIDLEGTVPSPTAPDARFGEQVFRDGRTGARLLVWRRARFVIFAAGGRTSDTVEAPPEDLLTGLAQQIDRALAILKVRVTASPFRAAAAIESRESAMLQTRAAAVAGDTVSTTVTSNLNSAKGAHKKIGEIDLRFDLTPVGPCAGEAICLGESEGRLPCDRWVAKVVLERISLNQDADDGDNWPSGDGDMRVGGRITLHSNCGKLEDPFFEFTTGEVGDLGPGGTLGRSNPDDELPKDLQIVPGLCACQGSKPRATWNLLVRDSDEGNFLDNITGVEGLILDAAETLGDLAGLPLSLSKGAGGEGAAKGTKELKDKIGTDTEDTTGPSSFQKLRETKGDDVGTSAATGELGTKK